MLGARTAAFLKRMAKGDKPFLYMPLTEPQAGDTASAVCQQNRPGPYGDFVMNVDDTVGKVLKALGNQAADNTLVMFTSDNGSFMYRVDDEDDHVKTPTKQQYHSKSHTANGPWRGTKADIWKADITCRSLPAGPARCRRVASAVITHTDLFATVAAIADAKFPRARPML